MNNTYRLIVSLVLVALAGGAGTAQTVRLNQVMRGKLQHSQRILEAVVTSNWALLDTESKALAQVTRDSGVVGLAVPRIRPPQRGLRAFD